MSDPYLGEIRMVAFDFAPSNWAQCLGQTMAISQNQALFALLGTTYGGDGIQTFQLPNLAGRSPVGTGNGAGLSPITLGEIAGTENFTLTNAQLPSHTHPAVFPATTVTAPVSVPATTSATGGQVSPATTTVLGEVSAAGRPASLYNTSAADTTLAPFNVSVPIAQTAVQVGLAGNGSPVPLRNPYLGVTFCIALAGIFPSRS